MPHDVVVEHIETTEAECWKAACVCGWSYLSPVKQPMRELDNAHAERTADIAAAQHRTQGFFADFAAEIRKPHFGDMQRKWMETLLTRAIEAKLYNPEDV